MLDNQEFVCSSLNVSVNPNKRRTADGRDVSPDVYNRKGGIGANTDYEPQVTCSTTGLEVIWPKTTNGYRYYLTVSAKPTNRGHLMDNGLYAYRDTGTFSQANVGDDTQSAYVYGGGGSAYQHLPVTPPKPPVTPPKPPVQQAPGGPVTVTVQVDAYGWGAAVGRRNSAWFGNKIAAFDDENVLKYREDGWLWQSATANSATPRLSSWRRSTSRR